MLQIVLNDKIDDPVYDFYIITVTDKKTEPFKFFFEFVINIFIYR